MDPVCEVYYHSHYHLQLLQDWVLTAGSADISHGLVLGLCRGYRHIVTSRSSPCSFCRGYCNGHYLGPLTYALRFRRHGKTDVEDKMKLRCCEEAAKQRSTAKNAADKKRCDQHVKHKSLLSCCSGHMISDSGNIGTFHPQPE